MAKPQITVNQKLDEILGLAVAPVLLLESESTDNKIITPIISTSGNPDKDMQDDFQFIRNGLYGLITKGNELVEDANFFAKEKQEAKPVEAAALAQREARENLMALINLHKTRKDIERVSSTSPGGDTTITQNVAFVGTTGDLLKFTKELGSNKMLSDALKLIDESESTKLNTIDATPTNNKK